MEESGTYCNLPYGNLPLLVSLRPDLGCLEVVVNETESDEGRAVGPPQVELPDGWEFYKDPSADSWVAIKSSAKLETPPVATEPALRGWSAPPLPACISTHSHRSVVGQDLAVDTSLAEFASTAFYPKAEAAAPATAAAPPPPPHTVVVAGGAVAPLLMRGRATLQVLP